MGRVDSRNGFGEKAEKYVGNDAVVALDHGCIQFTRLPAVALNDMFVYGFYAECSVARNALRYEHSYCLQTV